jgi:hypothetical protein
MFLGRALEKAPVLVLILFAVASFAAPALAQTYTISVQTSSPSYSGSQHIIISGVVSPAPAAANTAVIVFVVNPSNATVDLEYGSVTPVTGSYSVVTVAGGTANWIAGRYLVNATWGSSGGSATQTTTFQYSPAATTTTAVSCAPTSFGIGATSSCSATVSGAAGSISGETVTFSQTAGAGGIMQQAPGSVTFPSPATCTLSGTSCSVTATGATVGPAAIQALYPGDAGNANSSGTANLTVTKAETSTSVSCTPSTVNIPGVSTCTATVTGAAGKIVGETITFSQPSGETGSVNMTSPATCSLSSGGICAISIIGGTPGAVTIEAAYPGDASNAASSGTVSITAVLTSSTVTSSSSSSSSTSTSSSSTSSSSLTSISTSPTQTSSASTQSSGGGSGSLIYVVLAVVIIVIVVGVLFWRRRTARNYGSQPAST